jgi:formate dehydrogenase subunit delta
MLPDRLVTMANQIGRFFASQGKRGGEDHAVEEIADHLRRFWDPRMRAEIAQLSDEKLAKLDPLPRRAVASLAPGAARIQGNVEL